MRTVRLPPAICLTCGKTMDAATDALGLRKPEPLDISCCFYCGALYQFNDAMELCAVDDNILESVSVEGRAAIALLRQDIRERKRGPDQSAD